MEMNIIFIFKQGTPVHLSTYRLPYYGLIGSFLAIWPHIATYGNNIITHIMAVYMCPPDKNKFRLLIDAFPPFPHPWRLYILYRAR